MFRARAVVVALVCTLISFTAFADSLTLSNTQELQGNMVVTAQRTLEGGNTRVELYVLSQGAILNDVLGIDQLYYNNSWVDHPIIRISGAYEDELVLNGHAAGWGTNYAGCIASIFGCFASRTNSNPAGLDGTSESSPLIIWIAGDALVDEIAVHIRLDGASGWMTNRPTSMWTGESSSAPGFRLASTVPESETYVLLTLGCLALLRIKNIRIISRR